MGVLILYIAVLAAAAGIDEYLMRRPTRGARRTVAAAEELTAAAARTLTAADNRITVAQYEMTGLYEPPDPRPGAGAP
ncbi:hypothetical protein ABZ829_28050 [Streptomyces xanthochromogenes]|uniref:hypothetical protein n=1 Tax=Streptomyces xanthochromogenes TaxID=67384 RepID=UPI0034367CAA